MEAIRDAIAKEIQEKLSEFTLFDDDFMREFFQDNVDCVELLIQIILENPKLKVKSVDIQHDIKNYGFRDVTFDILAYDDENKIYDIEVQRSNHGAIPKRARFHSSILDAKSLNSKEDFSKLPETYIIFITENDVLRKGFPLYHIDRKILETNEIFDDEAHIIYVNGEYKGENPIGMLMHDFSCKNAKDMKYEKLAEKMKYYKEDEQGGKKMCDKLQAIWNKYEAEFKANAKEEAEKLVKEEAEKLAKEEAEKLANEKSKLIVKNLLKSTTLSKSEIALSVGLSLKEVEEIAITL